MEKNIDIQTIILTSAVVSALVSSIFSLINSVFNRNFEKNKTILEQAVRLTDIDHQREKDLMNNPRIHADFVFYTTFESYIGHMKTLRQSWSGNRIDARKVMNENFKKVSTRT